MDVLPIKKPSLVEITQERIKSYIVKNQLKPGDRLPSMHQLSETLQISRSVVREALKSLESLGLVDIKPGKGIIVGEFSIHSIMEQVAFQWNISGRKMKELIDTRRVLELGAIDLAIEHGDEERIEEMDRWNQLFIDKVHRGEHPQEEDLQFHHALFQATGNETYCQLSQVVHDYFNQTELTQIMSRDSYEAAYEQHSLIVHWIKKKDASRAKQWMIAHLEPLYRYLQYTSKEGATCETD